MLTTILRYLVVAAILAAWAWGAATHEKCPGTVRLQWFPLDVHPIPTVEHVARPAQRIAM